MKNSKMDINEVHNSLLTEDELAKSIGGDGDPAPSSAVLQLDLNSFMPDANHFLDIPRLIRDRRRSGRYGSAKPGISPAVPPVGPMMPPAD